MKQRLNDLWAVPVAAFLLSMGCAGPRTQLESASVPPIPLAAFPFDLYNNHIYVRALVNNDSAWLALDTGSPHTGLDSAWALEIGGLPVGGKGATFTGVSVDSMVLGGLQLRNYSVDLISTELISQASGRRIRGLLGAELLRHFTIEIDPTSGLVTLYDPKTYWYSGRGTIVPMVLHRGYLVARAQLKVQGGRPVKANFILDTGASRLCLILSRRFVSTHPQLDRPKNVAGAVGFGLKGQFDGRIVRVEELRLGTFVARAPTTGLPGEGTEKILDIPEDGLVGNQLLAHLGVVFDFARGRIILAKPDVGANACSYDMSGLYITTNGPSLEGIRVTHVAPGSPASDAGVRIGDEILALDERPASQLTLWEIRQALAVEGAKRELLLRRGADSLVVSLLLRPLL